MSKGVFCSLLASTLFGVLYFYSTLLAPLDGEDIFAWRMLLTAPFMICFTCLLGEFHQILRLWQRVCRQPCFFAVLCLSAALIGVQMWLFMWAPLHGRGLEVSLGYFMLPLVLVLVDRLFYKGTLSRWQRLAVIAACIGVVHELIRVGGFSWPALLVSCGFPAYFVLRRRFGLDNLGGLCWDMILLLPVATWFAVNGRVNAELLAQVPALYGLIPLLGVISAGALIAYILASRLLPFTVFGLLSYVEPVLLVVVALLIGETIQSTEWLTYVPIWLAVGFMALEGVLHLRREIGGRK